jgi:tRNA-modifying protein YgfZ
MVAMTNSSFLMQVRRDRAVLALTGAETEHFLQNLVTADVLGLAVGEARYSALLTPQGKILFDFFVVRQADGYLLDCAFSQLEELEKRLKFYRLRAKIMIAARPDLEVGVAPDKPEGMLAYVDPRSTQIGWRVIATAGTLPVGTGYDALRISLGLADSDGDIGSSQLFPHEANFDLLGAVSFTKGCYVGQEVVSRMQHRATARSRILPVAFEAAVQAKEIRSGDKVVGTVLSSSGEIALALIRTDRLDEARLPLLTDGVITKVLRTKT